MPTYQYCVYHNKVDDPRVMDCGQLVDDLKLPRGIVRQEAFSGSYHYGKVQADSNLEAQTRLMEYYIPEPEEPEPVHDYSQ